MDMDLNALDGPDRPCHSGSESALVGLIMKGSEQDLRPAHTALWQTGLMHELYASSMARQEHVCTQSSVKVQGISSKSKAFALKARPHTKQFGKPQLGLYWRGKSLSGRVSASAVRVLEQVRAAQDELLHSSAEWWQAWR